MDKLVLPVEQAYEDFQKWLSSSQDDLEGIDTVDMLFKAWLAARGLGIDTLLNEFRRFSG